MHAVNDEAAPNRTAQTSNDRNPITIMNENDRGSFFRFVVSHRRGLRSVRHEKTKRKEKAHATNREILGLRRVQRTKNLKEKKKKERKNCENIT